MSYEHLCYSYGAPPANIVVVANLQLASLAFVQAAEGKECFDLFQVRLKQWLKTSSVTEPGQFHERFVEVISQLLILELDALISPLVSIWENELLVKQNDGYVVLICYLDESV